LLQFLTHFPFFVLFVDLRVLCVPSDFRGFAFSPVRDLKQSESLPRARWLAWQHWA